MVWEEAHEMGIGTGSSRQCRLGLLTIRPRTNSNWPFKYFAIVVFSGEMDSLVKLLSFQYPALCRPPQNPPELPLFIAKGLVLARRH